MTEEQVLARVKEGAPRREGETWMNKLNGTGGLVQFPDGEMWQWAHRGDVWRVFLAQAAPK